MSEKKRGQMSEPVKTGCFDHKSVKLSNSLDTVWSGLHELILTQVQRLLMRFFPIYSLIMLFFKMSLS